jgi:hypothetical protein
MGTVRCGDDRLTAGRFSVEFVRTLRVPVEGGDYPLPPGFSTFPIYSVKRLAGRSAAAAQLDADFVVPFYQYEAMWLRFEAAEWKPNAVQIWAGGVNVLTGEPHFTAAPAPAELPRVSDAAVAGRIQDGR